MDMVIFEVVVQILGTLVITALGILGSWLTAKIGYKKELETLNIAKDEVIRVAQLTVQELQQTVVDGLKAHAADGKLTQGEIAALGNTLIAKTLEKLSAPTEALLRGAGVDLEKLITGAGEAMIAQMKRQGA